MQHRSIRIYALTILLALANRPVSGGEFTWDGDCQLPIWWQQCGNPLASNWTDDPNRPGNGDTVIIDASFGETILGNNFELQQVSVPGGLVARQGEVLTLTNGTSPITGLRLLGGGVRAEAGVTVELLSNASLFGDLYGPGLFLSLGNTDYSGLKLWDDGTIRNLFAATLSTGRMELNGLFVNRDELTVGGGANIEGSGTLNNDGTVRVGAANLDISTFDPDLLQTGGALIVENGYLQIRSSQVQLQGGSVEVSENAVLEFIFGLSGTHDRRFDGIDALTGLGLVDVLVEMTVAAPLSLELGSGTPSNGTGGFRLRKTLHLGDVLTNRGRFRFSNGTLVDQGGRFVNEGHAYTRSTGSATLGADTDNHGTFELGGASLSVEPSATFTNEELFLIEGGNVGGLGSFVNERSFFLLGSESLPTSLVTVDFSNATGTVVANRGTLDFTGNVEQLTNEGVLTGGVWLTLLDGRILFPRSIVEVGADATVHLVDGSIPDLGALTRVRGSLIIETDLETSGDVQTEGKGEIRVGPGGVLRTPSGVRFGSDPNQPAARLGLWPGGEVDSPAPIVFDDDATARGYIVVDDVSDVEIIFPEPRSTAVDPPPILRSPQVENHGRIMPTRRGAVGTLVVEGGYRQHASGRLDVEISEMESDELEVRGSVEIDGQLAVGRISPQPILGMPYTVLSASGTLTGTFGEVVSDDTVRVVYTPSSVQVIFDDFDPSEIFLNGFEGGDTAAWSATGG